MSKQTISKVAIFGASGRTGRELVQESLRRALEITALVRSSAALEPTPQLRVLTGNALDPEDVYKTITGQDAVLCALGGPPSDTSNIRACGTKNIISAMTALGVSRLICLSSFGVGQTKAQLPIFMKYFVRPFILKRAFEDHEAQEALVRASALEWTLVRPPQLLDASVQSDIHHNASGQPPVSMKIGRNDLARFMINQLSTRQYLQKAPCVANV